MALQAFSIVALQPPPAPEVELELDELELDPPHAPQLLCASLTHVASHAVSQQ